MATAMSAGSGFQRTKATYLEQEQELLQLVSDTEFQSHFQTWLDATISQLDIQFDGCETALAELQQAVRVDEGNYWTAKTLTQHCNLAIPERRLLNVDARLGEGERVSWHDLILLNGTLLALIKKLPEQEQFLRGVLEEVEQQHVVYAPRELAIIARSLHAKLGEETAESTSIAELERIQRQVERYTPELRDIEHLIEDSLANGDVELAVDQSYKQLEFYEKQLAAILEQYPVILRRHTDNHEHQRRRRWQVFRMANRDITNVMEAKLRQIDACMDDQRRIDDQIANYSNDDGYQRKRYQLDREQSDEFLEENKQRQRRVWNRVNQLYTQLIECQSELGTLGRARVAEVERRLQIEELEAGRRSGHSAFKVAAERRTKLLQDTIQNAERAYRLASTLNAFTLDQCDTVASRYDHAQASLQERLSKLRHTHLECFHEFYLKASRLIDRKKLQAQRARDATEAEAMQVELRSETLDPVAKRHAQERDKLAGWTRLLQTDIAMLRERVENVESDVERLVLRPFRRLGVPFLHPASIAGQITTIRTNKVLEIRDNLDKAKDIREHERAQEAERRDIEARRTQRQTERLEVLTGRVPHAPQGAGMESRKNTARYEKLLERAAALHGSGDGGDSSGTEGRVVPRASGSPSEPEPVPSPVGEGTHEIGVVGMSAASPPRARADARDRVHTGAAPRPPAPPLSTHRGVGGLTGAGGSSGSGLRDGVQVTALFTYHASDADELSFNRGDQFLCVTRAVDDGWYIGVHGTQQGVFPANYVKALE